MTARAKATSPEPPRALLLDFGEVLVHSVPNDAGTNRFIQRALPKLGASSYADVREAVTRAARAYEQWVEAETDRPSPREMTHTEFWYDLVAGHWPEKQRAAALENAGWLMAELERNRELRTVIPGTAELLKFATSAGLKVGLISNTLCGSAFAETLRDVGLADYFDVMVYSNEVGARKPNPEIFRIASDRLGVPLRDSWHVGDQFNKDVVGARRAGVGIVVAFGTGERAVGPPDAAQRPDISVSNHHELRTELAAAL